MVPLLIRILVLGTIAYLVYRVLSPSYPVKVTISSDGIIRCKGISKSVRRIIEEFAQEQLLDGEMVTIKGFHGEHDRIRWVFPKDMNPSLAQKFRNLILTEVDRR